MGVWVVFSYHRKQVIKNNYDSCGGGKKFYYNPLVESLCGLGSFLTCLLLVNSHLHAETTNKMVKYPKFVNGLKFGHWFII